MINIKKALKDKIKSIISDWNVPHIYAISFFVESNEAYTYRNFENVSRFAISYNTELDCIGAGQYDEERWNYAYWKQNEFLIIDPYYKTELTDLLFDWYAENGIDNLGEEPKDKYDENAHYIGKGPVGHYELVTIVSTIARELQSEEFIEKQMEIEEEPEPEKTEQLQEPEQTLDSILEEEPETPSDALVENTYLSAQTEEEQLSNLLNRLDMAEPIKRMNESAQEDMADVIERDEEKVELSEALPLKPSKSTLPKYQKPKFDFDIQPVSIPLDDQYSNISEYDEVPTIHDLENQWKDDSKPIIETVATSMEEAPQTFNTLEASDTPEAVDFTVPPEEIEPEQEVHSEEIVRKNGIGKRSYHKITIR